MRGNLAVVQSGGPTPVSNLILASVVRRAIESLPVSTTIFGALHGFYGILKGDLIDLRGVPHNTWQAISATPGAALGSSRYKLSEEQIEGFFETLDREDIRYIVAIGGNGTMGAAKSIAARAKQRGSELAVAGIPDSVDNDVPGTDVCHGYAACARYFAQTVIDIGADVKSLPTPVSIIEGMGRNTGWITAAAGLARAGDGDAPHRVYLPEVPLDPPTFLNDVRVAFDRWGWGVFAVAEGVCDASGIPLGLPINNPGEEDFGGRMMGDVGVKLARIVTAKLGLRARCEKPGLAARSSPSSVSDLDRRLAAESSAHTVKELCDGSAGFMASIRISPGDTASYQHYSLPLDRLSPGERRISAEFLSPLEGEPNDAFFTYAAPLIGSLRRYDSLLDRR